MSRPKATNRSRRLRKKLFLDEFAVHGFEVSCRIDFPSAAAADAFMDDFIGLIESRALCFGGAVSHRGGLDGFVTSAHRYGSATEADRRRVGQWLDAWPEVSAVRVGALTDACYGHFGPRPRVRG